MKKIILSALLALFTFVGNAQVLVSGVNHVQHANNVLRYSVSFNTNTAAKGWVEYSFVDGVDTVWQKTNITENAGTSHNIDLIGLLPETNYNYDVWAFDEMGCVQGTGGTFLTDTLPAGLPWMDSLWTAGNNVNLPGYFMTNSHTSSTKVFHIFDRKGRLIWYDYPEDSPSGTSSTRCKFFHWDNEKREIMSSDCHRITSKKLDGTVIRDIDLSARPDLYLHHDMSYKDDGSILAVVSQPRYIDQSSVGGSDSTYVMGQGYIVIDANDNITQEWHNFEHFDTLNTPAPGGYWLPIFGAGISNWMHGNAIMEDDDGNYMMSFKLAHQLAKIDDGTGTVLWKMGGTGSDIDVLPSDEYGDQHCINKTAGNDYLLFDNTGLDSISRVTQFNIDFGYSVPMLYTTWSFTLPQQFFTDILGSGYRTPYGNTMIATGRSRGVFEVESSGNVVWMGRQSDFVYRAYPVDQLYDPIETVAPGFASIICEDDNVLTLSAQPEGGQWSGTGVINGDFDPGVAGIGFHDLVYKYGYQSDTITIEVQDPLTCTANLPELAFGEQVRIYPSPFGDAGFSIRLDLPQATSFKANLIDVSGKNLGCFFDGILPEGDHVLNSGSIQLPAGVYLLELTTEDGNSVYKRIVKE